MNDEKKYNEIILSMTDSDGDIIEYELLDIVELDNIEYAILLPLITFDKKVEIYNTFNNWNFPISYCNATIL